MTEATISPAFVIRGTQPDCVVETEPRSGNVWVTQGDDLVVLDREMTINVVNALTTLANLPPLKPEADKHG